MVERCSLFRTLLGPVLSLRDARTCTSSINYRMMDTHLRASAAVRMLHAVASAREEGGGEDVYSLSQSVHRVGSVRRTRKCQHTGMMPQKPGEGSNVNVTNQSKRAKGSDNLLYRSPTQV